MSDFEFPPTPNLDSDPSSDSDSDSVASSIPSAQPIRDRSSFSETSAPGKRPYNHNGRKISNILFSKLKTYRKRLLTINTAIANTNKQEERINYSLREKKHQEVYRSDYELTSQAIKVKGISPESGKNWKESVGRNMSNCWLNSYQSIQNTCWKRLKESSRKLYQK